MVRRRGDRSLVIAAPFLLGESSPVYRDMHRLSELRTKLERSAWRRYGKGRHPAALNFGDCFAYALAKSSGEPLLAKEVHTHPGPGARSASAKLPPPDKPAKPKTRKQAAA